MTFPVHRGRRLRRTRTLRALPRETRLAPAQLVAPLFIAATEGERVPIPSLSGHPRPAPEEAAVEAARRSGTS